MTDMEFHPIANLFPLLDGEEFEALAEDIRAHGVREPIVVHEGLILDGRNRYRASKAAGADCPMRVFDGADPVAYVVSLNLKRRHLTESQKGMIAAKLSNLRWGQRKDLAEDVSQDTSAASDCKDEPISVPEAAQSLGISEPTVKRARKVLREGTPEQVAAVEAGQSTVVAEVKKIDAAKPKEKKPTGTKKPVAKRKAFRFWAQLREGLEKINGLPAPEDVVSEVHHTARADLDRRIGVAIAWLENFKEKWNEHQSEGGTESGDDGLVRLEDPAADSPNAEPAGSGGAADDAEQREPPPRQWAS